MKLFVCILDNNYTDAVEKKMKSRGYRMTELASTGGFFKRGSTTFLFGVNDEDVGDLRQSLQSVCLEVEKKKSKKLASKHRYMSFLLDAKEGVQFLANVKNQS